MPLALWGRTPDLPSTSNPAMRSTSERPTSESGICVAFGGGTEQDKAEDPVHICILL